MRIIPSILSRRISFLRFEQIIRNEQKFRLQMAYTTNIYIVGKRNGGEEWIQAGCDEYEKRLGPIMKLQTHFLKTDEDLVKSVQSINKGAVFCLDENGKMYDSVSFSKFIFANGYTEGNSVVSFVIGGFAGLPPELKKGYSLLSLSKMTWTHQMARLLLIEQIYRACEINKGSSYHKG